VAASAALLAAESAASHVYNVVDDGQTVSNARAKQELGWLPE
jgi:hypothetical protein